MTSNNLMSVVWFAGSFIARWLTRYPIKAVLPKLCLLSIIMSIVILIIVVNTNLSEFQLVIPALLMILIAATIFTFCYGASMTLFPHISGTNSAATGASLSLGTGTISSLAVFLKTDSDIPLFTTFLIFFTIASILYFVTVEKQLKKNQESN